MKLTRRIRAPNREHGQNHPKHQKHNRHPRNRHRPPPRVKRPRPKFPLAPHHPTENRRSPREIIARNRETEERLRGRGRDEAEESHDGGEEDAAPDGAEGDVAEGDGDGAEEAGEGEGAVAGERPGLAGGSDEDGEAHEELDEEEEGHEADGAGFAEGVVVNLRGVGSVAILSLGNIGLFGEGRGCGMLMRWERVLLGPLAVRKNCRGCSRGSGPCRRR